MFVFEATKHTPTENTACGPCLFGESDVRKMKKKENGRRYGFFYHICTLNG